MAGYANSIDDDILMVGADDPRTAILYRRTAADTYAAGVTITGVVREMISRQMLTAAGIVLLPQGSVAFHLQASQVGVVPKPGDVISESSQRYSIDSTDTLDEGKRYRVVAIPEV